MTPVVVDATVAAAEAEIEADVASAAAAIEVAADEAEAGTRAVAAIENRGRADHRATDRRVPRITNQNENQRNKNLPRNSSFQDGV